MTAMGQGGGTRTGPRLGPRLELRQTTQLVMTPQLQLAIRLLQMSNLDLAAFLADELERNPLLDLVPPEPPPASSTAPLPPGDETADLTGEVPPEGREAPSDPPPPPDAGGWTPATGPGGGEVPELSETLACERTLRDHVLEQLGLMHATRATCALARLMVDELDEAGYLATPLTDIAARHGATTAEAQAALSLLQGCDPTGVGARDLAEGLALQLAERDRLDPAMEAVLAHLPLLASGRFDALMDLAGVGREDMAGIVAEIRALDPRPGLAFGSHLAQAVSPDVLVRRAEDGGWLVELNTDTLPRVLVDTAYGARVTAGGGEARAFIAECRMNASWLVKTLDQRARTILRVATEIVKRQAGFFDRGVAGLTPLTLREVAETLALHESTISRVTAGKYLACDRGVVELKFFFGAGLAATDGGAALSATAIRDRIRRLIEAESHDQVLSDDTLVEILQRDGIDIARRTVAKYRDAMNIPSSVHRRRHKAGLRMR